MLTAVTRWYRPQGRLTMEQLVESYTDLSLGMMRIDAASVAHIASIAGPTPKSARPLSSLTAAATRRARRAEPILAAESAEG